MRIEPPTIVRPVVDEQGKMVQEMWTWTQNVSKLGTLTGVGSPEGVEKGLVTQRYMDTAGSTGNIEYIKRDAEISGDETQGWILV